MKKGRLGVLLSVVAVPDDIHKLEQIIFQHTSSIGIRRFLSDRHKLARRSVNVETKFGTVRGKVVTLPDGQERFSVEDDDARLLAQKNQTTAFVIVDAATAAWSNKE